MIRLFVVPIFLATFILITGCSDSNKPASKDDLHHLRQQMESQKKFKSEPLDIQFTEKMENSENCVVKIESGFLYAVEQNKYGSIYPAPETTWRFSTFSCSELADNITPSAFFDGVRWYFSDSDGLPAGTYAACLKITVNDESTSYYEETMLSGELRFPSSSNLKPKFGLQNRDETDETFWKKSMQCNLERKRLRIKFK